MSQCTNPMVLWHLLILLLQCSAHLVTSTTLQLTDASAAQLEHTNLSLDKITALHVQGIPPLIMMAQQM